jgi:hypothetical protein
MNRDELFGVTDGAGRPRRVAQPTALTSGAPSISAYYPDCIAELRIVMIDSLGAQTKDGSVMPR